MQSGNEEAVSGLRSGSLGSSMVVLFHLFECPNVDALGMAVWNLDRPLSELLGAIGGKINLHCKSAMLKNQSRLQQKMR